jgi:hypothetical protein
VTLAPGETKGKAGTVIAISGTASVSVVPVPLSVTVCGLLLALSARLRLALNIPEDVGLKVTVIVQLAPAATLVPQVLVSEYELALLPVIEIPSPMPLRLSAPLPVL